MFQTVALRLLFAALAHANGTISSSAERDAWTVIAQAFIKSSEPELAAKAMSRATRLGESGSDRTIGPGRSRWRLRSTWKPQSSY